MSPRFSSLDDLLFPALLLAKWQMMPWERIALTGILSRLRPKCALEIGVYYGGSLSLISEYADRVIAVDIDPEVPGRFALPPNVDLRIGSSETIVPALLDELEHGDVALNFVLIDADHTADGARRDIELVLHYEPREPMLMVMHDSGNPHCRKGILSADWDSNPFVQSVECDFVPGNVIEHGVKDGRGEVWGGLALAFLHPTRRIGPVPIGQAARTTIECLHKLDPKG